MERGRRKKEEEEKRREERNEGRRASVKGGIKGRQGLGSGIRGEGRKE